MEVKKAVLQTLAYADVFDFPLSFSEICHYLIAEKQITEKDIKKSLVTLHGVLKQGVWYCFFDRKALIATRRQREKDSEEKLQKARKIGKLLSFIPTVSVIGISGALAMKNASRDDDIDFFIITRPHTIWLTRLIICLLLAVTGNLRIRNKKKVKNMVCLNMLLDETIMAFEKKKQTLYTAHEIIQMKPIVSKHKTYERFLQANEWVKKYLPHAFDANYAWPKNHQENNSLLFRFLLPFEFLAKFAQLWYMRTITRETVTDHLLAFHPKDYEHEIIEVYRERLHKYGVL